MAVTFTPNFADCINSFYEYVKTRILTINPARQILGISQAQDWPPANVVFNAFYLLNMGSVRDGGTTTVPGYTHTVQWTWLVMGTDLKTGIRGRNRGDRYAITQAMRGEIVQAVFPGFAQKFTWAADTANEQLQSQAASPVEQIRWGDPIFAERVEKQAGALYDYATIRVSEWIIPRS